MKILSGILSLLAPILILLLSSSAEAFPPSSLETLSLPEAGQLSWSIQSRTDREDGLELELWLRSQRWRDQEWQHRLFILIPKRLVAPKFAALYITGSGDPGSEIAHMRDLAGRVGIAAAIITNVPHQPMFGGKKEDALLAFSFLQFFNTGDYTWPVVPAMVKAVRGAMTAISSTVEEQIGAYQRGEVKLDSFILTGASKRGWTTWLAGLVDTRVVAIAPRVFDMLNIKSQVEWAAKHYGMQSERIKEYTQLGLVDRLNEKRGEDLLRLVDPYQHLAKRPLPTLILLGTNDPYWVVDSASLYWSTLPGRKLLYQAPNTGHHLGGVAKVQETFVSFVDLITHNDELPRFNWSYSERVGDRAVLAVTLPESTQQLTLMRANSPDRDFRNDSWQVIASQILTPGLQTSIRRSQVSQSRTPYRLDIPLQLSSEAPFQAYLTEIETQTARGMSLYLSSEAVVYSR